jgi:hypothetical protein
LTGVLALFLGIFSIKTYNKSGRPLTDEMKTAVENRSYLVLLSAVVVLLIKLFSWPLFYATLQSYVPHLHGAMCIYGVTQVNPLLSGSIQIFKPVVVFFIGGWLFLNSLDKTTETVPLFRKRLLLLSIASLFILADSIGDFIYFTSFDSKLDVACCSTFFDLPERPTAAIPSSIIGEDYERYMLPLYYATNILFAVFLGISRRNINIEKLVMPIALVVLSILNAVVTIFAMFEVIAPEAMKLPFHRCVYCMWQYRPDSIVMTAAFIIGAFSPAWALFLNVTGKNDETASHLKEYMKRLYFAGMTGIAVSLIMATIYLFR